MHECITFVVLFFYGYTQFTIVYVYVCLQGQFQLYIVVYDVYRINGMPMGRFAIDRFPINVTLDEIPSSLSRQTYDGIYGIAQLDLSFEIESDDYMHFIPNCTTAATPPGTTGNVRQSASTPPNTEGTPRGTDLVMVSDSNVQLEGTITARTCY